MEEKQHNGTAGKNSYSDNPSVSLVKHMLHYVSKDSLSLLDLGCGSRESAELLLNAVPEYWGVDYVNSGNDAIIDEYNSGDFPDVAADTVLCSDCLEYIKATDEFLQKICRSSWKEVILSYCPAEYSGKANHMTTDELMKQFQINGFAIEQSETTIGNRVIFRFFNQRQNMINQIRQKHLTYLEGNALKDLMESVSAANELDGCMIETGCALGGSGICIAHEKNDDKPLFIYDVFGMIPAPGERDGTDVRNRYEVIKEGKSVGIGGDLYYGYQDNLMDTVRDNFCSVLGIKNLQEKNIVLVKGLFQDTLVCEQPVSFAHIDCDWYDSVMVCLERIVPQLVQGGTLVIDDYCHWSGCRMAVDEYFKDKKDDFTFEMKSRLHIVKK